MQRAVDEGGDHDSILDDVEGRTEGRALEAVGTVKGSASIKWRGNGFKARKHAKRMGRKA